MTRTAAWWESQSAGPALHERVCGAASEAWAADAGRRTRALRYARAYMNRNIGGLTPETYNTFQDAASDQIRIILTRSMVDAIQARISKNRPKPTSVTERAGFELQQQAKRQDAFVWGVFSREKAYRRGPAVFRDAMIWGDGMVKVSGAAEREGDRVVGRVRHERVFPWECFVDEREGFYGTPRTMYQIHNVDRGVLKALFPTKSGRIDSASGESILDYSGGMSTQLSDRLQVIEAWHLPSSAGSADGRHVITLKSLVLNGKRSNGDPWTHSRFPFARFQWSEPPFGYWGQGLVETSSPINKEVNELAKKIQAGMYWHSRPVTVVDDRADIEWGDLDNDLRGNVVSVKGGASAIQFTVPPAVHAEVYQHLERLIRLGYAMEGVSELSVASKKPAGLDSRVALQEFNDIESERFILPGQRYEDLYLDLGELTLLAAKDLAAQGIDVEVSAEVRRFRRRYIDRIKWSEINIESDRFELKVFPTSSLPHTPAGKRQAVEGLMQSGFISREQAMELMDLPDIDAVMQRELAPFEIILFQMEAILEDGELVAPIPYQDLQMSLKVAQTTLLRAVIDEVPPERRDLLQQFIGAVEDLITLANQAAQPPPGQSSDQQPQQPGPQPQAQPEATA